MSRTGIKLLIYLFAIGWLHSQCTYKVSQVGTHSNRTTQPTSTQPTTSETTISTTETADKPKERTTTDEPSPEWTDAKLRTEIVAYSKQLIGSKYKYGGTAPNGFDCSGFTGHVMKEFDIPLDRTSSSQAKQGKKISLKDAKPGDLVFFSRSGKIFHVAIIASNKKGKTEIVHSTSSKGVIVNDLKSSSYWLPKLHSVRDVTSLVN